MPTIVRLPDGTQFDYDALTPAQQKAAEPALRQWTALLQSNPLWGFSPFGTKGLQYATRKEALQGLDRGERRSTPNSDEGAQLAFLRAGRIKTKMGAAGNQAGKTEIGVVDDLIQCVDRDVLPPWLQEFKFWEPPFLLRVVTMDLGNSLHGVMIPKWQRLVPRDQLRGGSWAKAFDKTLRTLHFKNGSMVQFLSAEQEREKHQGATLDRIHFDEEPPPPNGYAIYEESRMRVMARSGQLMFTMTPLLGLSWTYDELWETEDPSVFKVKWSLLDNPWIADEDVRGEIARMPTDAVYQARIDGNFTAFRGRVLEEFDRSLHIVQPPKPVQIRGMETIIGYDPGLTRGGVVWVAFDKDYDALVYDELYPQGLGVPAIAHLIREKNKLWGIEDPLIVVDPASRIRDMSTAAETVETALIREGFWVVPGQNDRLAGVLEMKARLGAGALKVSSACTSWLREQDRWLVASDEETQESRPRSNVKGASFATIGPDHLMDPTRYVLMERAWDPTPPRPTAQLVPSFQQNRAPDLRRHRGAAPSLPLGRMS